MHFDISLPTASPMATPELLAAVGQEADRRAIHAIWVPEHAIELADYGSSYPYAPDGKMPLPPGCGMLEPFTTLAFLAAHTTTTRLGTAMCLLPQRNPVYTAKEVVTVDWLSGGRVDLGVGVGWLREEFEVLNVPWPRRGPRTDEYLEVLRALWSDGEAALDGEFFALPPSTMHPKPIQQPHPPIHIGGESDAALRRVARAGQGWHTMNRPPEELAGALARLDELLGEASRTRDDCLVTVSPYFLPLDADAVERYAEAGADAVTAFLLAFSPEDVEPTFDALQPLIDRAQRC
ncbi:MAG TPA: LLM class F420-dependent oxidoreductase [Acidimicrobiales bacterium]|nr:LLM class F420-dependent oxidoreductase [Acidimicrobiales bacterium]